MGRSKRKTQHLPVRPAPNQLPPNNSEKFIAAQFQHYQGPLPKPQDLHEYDQILPGSAERIISMWEEQVRHRHGLERSVIDSDVTNSKKGLMLGFVISVISIIAGSICIWHGNTVGGTIIGGPAVPALVGVFVYGSRLRKKERDQRNKEGA